MKLMQPTKTRVQVMTAKTLEGGHAVLNRNTETLRTQQELNIDDLLMIVTESVAE